MRLLLTLLGGGILLLLLEQLSLLLEGGAILDLELPALHKCDDSGATAVDKGVGLADVTLPPLLPRCIPFKPYIVEHEGFNSWLGESCVVAEGLD